MTDRRDPSLFPIASLETIDKERCNQALVAWEHKMGPWARPCYGEWFHGLYHGEGLVAVSATATLIADNVCGLGRDEAFELGRMCAATPHSNRVMLRLWRECFARPLARARGWTWAVSYQDSKKHKGNLYRFDGWTRLGESRSGTDTRSGREGRSKVIWGFEFK